MCYYIYGEVFTIKLFIVRHGKTDWNLLGIVQGSTDISLNEEGIIEARNLSEKIDISKIDLCISSPLKRAMEISKIITKNKIEIIYDDLIKERYIGDYEGCSINFDVISRLWDYKLNDSSNNIESIKECLNRASSFINKIKGNYKDKAILIVSHGGFIKCINYVLKGYNESTDFLSFNPKNTTLYEYDISE